MSTLVAESLPPALEGRGFIRTHDQEYVAAKAMSFEEYLATDTEGRRAEWVDGEMRIYMPTTLLHQTIQDFLIALMNAFGRRQQIGRAISAGYPMQSVRGGNGREPDLVFVRSEHKDRIGPTHLVGAPDVVVELVSTESVGRDYVDKFREYQAAGVPEYWLIDTREGIQRADFYLLEDGHFVPAFPDAGGIYHSTAIPGFWLRLSWLWEAEPDPLAALKEILAGPPA